LLKATTGNLILPETANNGLESSKVVGEVEKQWVTHANHRRLVRQTVPAIPHSLLVLKMKVYKCGFNSPRFMRIILQ
jgi:hypothetical protein